VSSSSLLGEQTHALIERGFDALSRRDHEGAAAAADTLLAVDPTQVDALYLRGLLAQARDDVEAAQDYFERAILAKGDFPDPYIGLLEILKTMGRRSDFDSVLELAKSRVPTSPATTLAIARLLVQEHPERAIEEVNALGDVVAEDPGQVALQAIRTRALIALGRRSEVLAECYMPDARSCTPQELLGASVRLLQADRPHDACRLLEAGLTRYPEDPVLRYNLCHALHRAGEDGVCDRELDRLLSRFDDNDALFLRAFRYLREGRFREGFALYETRLRMQSIDVAKAAPIPAWDGGPLEGRRLLVLNEQGYGDNLMCIRFLPLLLDRGADVTYLCPEPLYSLVAWQPSLRSARVLTRLVLTPWNQGDVYANIMSLPHLLGLEDPVSSVRFPYLEVPTALLRSWAARLGGARRTTVGVVWAANPNQLVGKERSVPLEMLTPMFSTPGVRFVSLQVGPAALDQPMHGLQDLAPQLEDFADTCAAVSCCDLVISVDTSVAHVAGAIGKPVWVMTPFVTDWRFSMNGAGRAHWYPSARVFRQPAPGQWTPVINEVRAELGRLMSTRSR